MLEPMPVQSPFAAGRNQLVADQRLQDVQPVRPFARGRQRRKPELVQSQLIPQKSGHPAGTPLTRPTQSHLAQSDRHHIAIERRGNTILGKQRNLFGLPGAFIEDLNRPAPRRFLAVVDLSKIQHLPLNHATIMNAPVLHNRPCPMSLAVLVANLGAQKHDADLRLARGRARSLVGTTGVLANLSSAKSSACRDQTPRKSKKSRPVGEVRLAWTRRRHSHNMRPFVGIIISLMACLAASISLAGEPLPRSVLVLDQFELASPLGSAIFSGFRSTLNKETAAPLSIYVESLDLTRFAGQRFEGALQLYLREKYSDKPIGVIMVNGQKALELALQLRTRLWSDVPVIFAGVDEETDKRLKLPRDVTGTTIRLSLNDW